MMRGVRGLPLSSVPYAPPPAVEDTIMPCICAHFYMPFSNDEDGADDDVLSHSGAYDTCADFHIFVVARSVGVRCTSYSQFQLRFVLFFVPGMFLFTSEMLLPLRSCWNLYRDHELLIVYFLFFWR